MVPGQMLLSCPTRSKSIPFVHFGIVLFENNSDLNRTLNHFFGLLFNLPPHSYLRYRTAQYPSNCLLNHNCDVFFIVKSKPKRNKKKNKFNFDHWFVKFVLLKCPYIVFLRFKWRFYYHWLWICNTRTNVQINIQSNECNWL